MWNIKRDDDKISQLEALGWRVLIIWQCEIKNEELRNMRLKKLVDQILYNN